MQFFNFHTHTLFCDGHAEPEAYVQEALKNNMAALGFSCHSPLPFENGYSLKEDAMDDYITVVRELQVKHRNKINIFLGTEFDYVPGMSEDTGPLLHKMNPDFLISSVHLVRNKENGKLWFIDGPESNYTSGLDSVFNMDIRLAVSTYFEQIMEMIICTKPDIIGHVDKVKMHNQNRFFSEDEKWYTALVNKMLDVAERSRAIIEVNTRGIYKKRCESLYPGEPILKEIRKRKIPVTISTDAHAPNELLLYYKETIQVLKELGFKSIKCLMDKTWQDVAI